MSRQPFAFAIALLLTVGCGNDDRTAATVDGGVDTGSDASEDSASEDAGSDTIVDPTPDAGPDTVPQPPQEQCIPYDDQCAEGEYCQYFTEGDPLRCIAEGDVEPDPGGTNPECPTGVCSRGGICMPQRNPFGDDPPVRFICYQPCELDEEWEDRDCWNSRHTCWPVEGPDGEPLSFGICEY